jgi:polyisoprenoid-binding protein YceI
MDTMGRKLMVLLLVMMGIASARANAADTFKVDPVHSFATFKIRHLGISNVTGDFSAIDGVITADKKNPAASAVEITIQTKSVNTHSDMRDNDLRSPNFFDVQKYPDMTFKSTKVRKLSATKYEVTGVFTLLGVKKTIKVKVDYLGEAKGMQGEMRAGFETAFTIKRSDYGMKKDLPLVGDEVQISLSVEAIKQ